MSWSLLAPALVTRLTAIPGVGKAYPYWPLYSGNSSHPKFKELFVADGAMNAWMLRREAVRHEPSADSDTVSSSVYRVSLTAMVAMQMEVASAEQDFQDLLDAVHDDFRGGDRSFGGAALTADVIEWTGINEVAFFGVLCYRAEGRFDVEVLHGP